MHAHSRAIGIAVDFNSIANLMHEPEPAPAARRIGGRPGLSCQRIADLALILNLAHDLVVRYPAGN